jgi:Na+-transporting methylmalonyl-CoA/oxaloacetate decarboxylase gamma subunit
VSDTLTTALVITLIGMSLVFGAILLFWALMSALVRLTGERATAVADAEVDAGPAAERALKERAALVAVAVALACEAGEGPQPFPLPPTALVSTWQAVMRSRLLGQRGDVR